MKKIIIFSVILVVVVVLIMLGIRFNMSSKKEEVVEVPTPTAVALPTISENIVVELTSKNNNRVVKLGIKGLAADIESIDYELTYMTGSGLPRGVLGKINLKGEKEIIRDDIVLGTCSSGKCAYDTGVTSVDLSLKFNSSNGESSVFQKTYPF